MGCFKIKKNLLLSINIFLLIFLTIVLSGCEDKEEILDQYVGNRLGVILESNVPDNYPGLSSTLIDYINRRVDMQVIDPELLINMEDRTIAGKYSSSPEKFYRAHGREKLGLDLLLTVKLSDLLFKEGFPSFQFGEEYMELKVTYSCSLTLSYVLRDLRSDKIIHLGQSSGDSEKSFQIGAGKDKIKINNEKVKLEEIDRYTLMKEAMLGAIRATKLL